MRVVVASVPGKVSHVHVKPGDKVVAGQILVDLEVMQMRQQISSPIDGRVRLLLARVGDVVVQGALLAEVSSI